MKLVGGGSVINGATPSSLPVDKQLWIQQKHESSIRRKRRISLVLKENFKVKFFCFFCKKKTFLISLHQHHISVISFFKKAFQSPLALGNIIITRIKSVHHCTVLHSKVYYTSSSLYSTEQGINVYITVEPCISRYNNVIHCIALSIPV